MNIDKYEIDDRLTIVSENYIFCDCDEGCIDCLDECFYYDEEE